MMFVAHEFDFNTAANLPNGAEIIERQTVGENRVVLCRWHGAMPYVTWRCDAQGNAYWGHYKSDLAKAVEDFNERIQTLRRQADDERTWERQQRLQHIAN